MGRTDMAGTFHRYNVDKAIGLTIGFLIGVIPVAEYNIPVLIILLSVIFGIKHIDRQSAKAAFPIILYCASMIGFMIYHPGGWEYDDKLVKVMATIAIAAVPMVAMFRTYVGSLERVEVSILLGIMTICVVFAYQYFIEGGCRVSAFSVGPLGPPITLLPLSMYLVTKRCLENRFSVLDGLVICLLFISMGAFLGARMHFYSLTLLCIILVVILTVKNKFHLSVTISLCAVVGIYGAYNFDKCGDFKRMENHFKIFQILLPQAEQAVESQAHTAGVQIANNFITVRGISTDATPASYTFTPSVDEVTTTSNKSKILQAKQDSIPNRLVQAEKVEGSSALRIQIWRRSLTHIFELEIPKRFLFGSGRITERDLSLPQPHAHNQFLSWMISAGFVGLTVALIMFAPLIFRQFTDFPVFIFMSACFLCFITDSPLWIRDTTSQFLIMLLFVMTFIKKPSTH
jgi:O-antigen ligase